ncbi:hotdog fold thioesterase [Desulfobotulus sp. H1]|uniref:Hotdog fold thioesterase n=1 Tax=Desulfobotulus pelophilus TaxID=2823377 RepID=A0ABT3N8I0_9BACT|nr:hotdog fold domain-containing protein [Desulfobotulus pelophilus]MCW7753760.1 hotdog fold thioesterase [Desulfobotulus pelophilus]
MIRETLTILPRFCGPSNSGNGGYVCGCIARHIPGVTSVRLRMPPPLNVPLQLESHDTGARLFFGDKLVGEGRPALLEMEKPEFISFDRAMDAARSYAGFRYHSFPRCFVCGPLREKGDGLQIFAGPVCQESVVASPWVVDASLARDGVVPDAFLWAALDCPGAFAVAPSVGKGMTVVLGELTASINGKVKPGDRCVAMGWPLETDGRRHAAGTAVFSESGKLIGLARATWVEISENLFPPENPKQNSHTSTV